MALGFLGFFVFILPLIAAVIGMMIALLFFIGICLLAIGVTGLMMHKIHSKHIQSGIGVFPRFYPISSIVLGLVFMAFPAGYVLHLLISSLLR